MSTRALEPPEVRQHPTSPGIKITTWHSNSHLNGVSSRGNTPTNELVHPLNQIQWEHSSSSQTNGHKSDRHLQSISSSSSSSSSSRPERYGSNDLSSDFRSPESKRRNMHHNVGEYDNLKPLVPNGHHNVSPKPLPKQRVAEMPEPDRHRIQSLERAVSDLQQGLFITQEELARTQAELKETQRMLCRFQYIGLNDN